MSQFRNSSDILLEILATAGEPTNGNSPYQSLAQTYMNRFHQVIVAGGSFMNINVDEPWVWARHRFPMVVELQPAYTAGYINTINANPNISFTTAPSVSVEGWHIQALSTSTMYKIMNHTAGGTTAQLDSNFVDSGGLYSFRSFQIDYPIAPVYLYVDSANDKLDFQEGAGVLTATIPHGAYTPTNFASSIAVYMNSSGTAGYTASYDTVAQTYTVASSVTAFSIRAATGPNTNRSTWRALGFDTLDQTPSSTVATTYTGVYQPNQVSRLIEPFKLNQYNFWGEHLVYSTDPIKMQEDYPLTQIQSRFPDRFCRLTESPNGNIVVRFNAYPTQLAKLTIDWVPQPMDLQNNTASFTRLPRQDIDALIQGAAAQILFNKSDSKWEMRKKFASDHLDAMKKKNHGALLRTGEYFGQIVAREDLNRMVRHNFKYGYLFSGSTAQQVTAQSTQTLFTEVFSYQAFQTAATVASVTANTLAANMVLFSVIVKHSQSFTGSGLTGIVLNVGIQSNPTKFINGFNVEQATAATAQASNLTQYAPFASTPIIAQMVSTGGNLSALTQGSVTIYLQETTLS